MLVDKKYHLIHSLKINNKDVIFDIFAINNELILICPYYVSNIFSEISIECNKKIIKNPIILLYNDRDPILIVKYAITEKEDLVVKINYQKEIFYFSIYHQIVHNKQTLVAGTLCKFDYNDIKYYYDYYLKQGCDYFIIYYNGKMPQSIKDKYEKSSLMIIDWDFIYMPNNIQKVFYYAQTAQINHLLYKYAKPMFDWIISCDLDEYMHINNCILFDFIKSTQYQCIKFENYWSELVQDKDSIESIYNTEIRKNLYSQGSDFRTKILVRSDSVDALGVHNTKNSIKEHTPENSYMLHMTNWSKPRRMNVDKNEIIQIIT